MSYAERNRLLENMGYRNLVAYLESERYADILFDVLERDHSCRLCGGTATGVHFCQYDFGSLMGFDIRHLRAICEPCCRKIERGEDGKRVPFSEVVHRVNTLGGWRLLPGIKPAKPRKYTPPSQEPRTKKETIVRNNRRSVIRKEMTRDMGYQERKNRRFQPLFIPSIAMLVYSDDPQDAKTSAEPRVPL